MKIADEITVLRTVVDALAPLEPEAQQRVIDYVCNRFGYGRSRAPMPGSHEAQRNSSTGKPRETDKPIPPQQYLRDYNYKIMTKRIGVMAVFLERERGMKRFSLRNITDAFRAAKESKQPAHSQYARAVVMGYLGKDGDQYYAAAKAEELVGGRKQVEGGENADEET